MQFPGSNPKAQIRGIDIQPGHSNFFIGKDPALWRTDVPHFARVRIDELYPGIDLVYYGNDRQLEYDLTVAPHASADRIRIRFGNARRVLVAPNGDLIVDVAGSTLKLLKPDIYQEVAGVRKSIAGGYIVEPGNRVRFQIGAYDRNRPIIVDPVLSYATYLGGSSNDSAFAVATDSAGNSYVAGSTASTDFPTTVGAYKATRPGGATDAFVVKYSPTGSLLYSTYLGGSAGDEAYGVAVDSANNAYVTGYTSSADFPTTSRAFSTTYQGGASDAFVVKLNPAGNGLVYSTYIGGPGEDIAYGIALDAANEPTLTGSTAAPGFPTTAGASQTSYGGGISDAFVVRLGAAGTTLLYSSYLGGSGEDVGYGVALDSHANAYVTGYTQSADFPSTTGAAQTANAGGYDAFVTALNPGGNALLYSTYLGGSGDDYGLAVAVNTNGSAYVTGYTKSADYPTTSGVLQSVKGSGNDAIVTKLTSVGAIAYSTFLGGSGDDYGLAIALDAAGNAYVAGGTGSANFPLLKPIQSTIAGLFNVFVAELNPTATALAGSTFIGGSGVDTGYGIALDSMGGVNVVGETTSANFPVASGAAQTALSGLSDAFVARLVFQASLSIASSHSLNFAIGQDGADYSLTVSNNGAPTTGLVTVAEMLPAGLMATALSGIGWNCVLATLTCTRSDSLASSMSYPVIAVTVNVTAVAPTTVINQASASGGGGSGSVSASDLTVIAGTGTTAQTISFGALVNVGFSVSPVTLAATASSGLTVTFTSATMAVCTVSGNAVTLVTVGICSMTARQPGNAAYAAAASLTQSFTVGQGPQTIAFGPLSAVTLPAPAATLTASSSSGLSVVFASTTPSVCTVGGRTLTPLAAGICSIAASQAGNLNYAAATSVSQSFVIQQATQTITFAALGNIALPASAFTLTAEASSALPVGFVSMSSVCTVSGTTLTPVAAGTCSITASQTGNANYSAAVSVTQAFTINPASGGGGGGGGGSGSSNPLTASPAALTFNAAAGGAIANQSMTLSYQTFTQGAPTWSCNTTINQGAGWLGVVPASGAMTQSSYAGFLYTYRAIVVVTANPTNIGAGSSYTGNVNCSAGGGIAAVPVTMNVAQPALFTLAPSSLAFNYLAGNPNTPLQQGISVFSNPSGASFAASASSNGGWLSVSDSAIATPGSVPVTVNVAGLAAGTFAGRVTVASGAATSITVPVALTIVVANPQLSVSPVAENVAVPQGGVPVSGQVTVSNAGGGTLQWTATSTGGQGNWLNLSGAAKGSAIPSVPDILGFTADPTGLVGGLYTAQITVSDANSASETTVNVMLIVTNAAPAISLSQTGLAFTVVSGGTPPAAQSFTVSNAGTGSLNWSAQGQVVANPLSDTNWLIVAPGSGTSGSGLTGTAVAVSANTANLQVGQYYASIDVAAPNAVNSPQIVSVTLNVVASASSPGPVVSTGGLLLTGSAGSATPLQQTLTLFNPSSSTVNFPSSTFTSTGGPWLSVTPSTSGLLSPGANSLPFTVNLLPLSPAVQTGNLLLAFTGGNVVTIPVVLLALGESLPAGSVPSASRPLTTTTAVCPGGKPSFLIPVLLQPSVQSGIQVANPSTVRVEVVDDCGNATTAKNGGAVQVTFSNGDAVLNLNDVAGAIWEATWTPGNAATSVTLQASASEQGMTLSPSLIVGSSESVTVQPANGNSAAQATGVVNAASSAQAMAGIVSPGSYVAIYGTRLAGNGSPSATSLPLPTTLNGTQVTLGGLPMPLLYASAGQLNALVPQGLAPNAEYPLAVVRGSTQSVPVPLTVTPLQPAIYTLDESGSGQAIAEIAGTAWLAAPAGNGSRPVQSGSEYLAVFCTGLGMVQGPNGEEEPGDGVAAPAGPIFQTTAQVLATIGGVNAPVTFAGLTPSFAGLYQVNIQVPAAVQTGSAVPLTLTVTDPVTAVVAYSNTVTIAVQQAGH